jgi:RHS repeat-associated protein
MSTGPNPDVDALADSTDGSERPFFALPQITVPSGGGAIRGIGETFRANVSNGTAAVTVPIALSPGRSGFGPQLSVSYDSGAGNGPFGLGWSLSLPAITRKTDRGIPRYDDEEYPDVFVFSGAEDLVQVLQRDQTGQWIRDSRERDGYLVRRYRPRVESSFARIERWTSLETGEEHWRSFSPSNRLTVYGRTPESRIFDPTDPRHVFSWLACESYDPAGNAILYEYVGEDDGGIDLTLPSERHRTRTANRYLSRVRYGNARPLLIDPDATSRRSSHLVIEALASERWMYDAVFEYGDGRSRTRSEGDIEMPTSYPLADMEWSARPDPFSSYRSGFEIRTHRLCSRVLMYNHFPFELSADDYLVRATEFVYDANPIASLLTSIVQSGYSRRTDGRYRKISLPPLELSYSTNPLRDSQCPHYEIVQSEQTTLPEGVDGKDYMWADLDGEGISGVLSEQGNAWFYAANAGDGRILQPTCIPERPSSAMLRTGQGQLLDIAGDGQLDFAVLGGPTAGYYCRTGTEGWGPFRPFLSCPNVNWEDPNLRFVDVTGNGIADIVVSDGGTFTWHRSLLESGFANGIRVPAPSDERSSPRIMFADPSQSIYLADMSGDGLSDVVRIRNGEVCYWPNLGYGVFGKRVTMTNSPWFDAPDLFSQSRIRLADTDGSGATDIVYCDSNGIRIYLNESGNSWSDARLLDGVPPLTEQTEIAVLDFLGRGTSCLTFSSALPSESGRPIRYVDLMSGHKPYLLVGMRNNLGADKVITYRSSTEFCLADKAAGHPWITRLPFPVHVVSRVESYDHVLRNRFVETYSYHHGNFDGIEREFRGFGRVDQLDTEEIPAISGAPTAVNWSRSTSVPPTLTRTWFHTGIYDSPRGLSRDLEREYYEEPGLPRDARASRQLPDSTIPDGLTPAEAREAVRALKGTTRRREIYALDGTDAASRPYTVTESTFTVKRLQPRGVNDHGVFFTHTRESLTLNYERVLYDVEGELRADPRRSHNITLDVDYYGNVLSAAQIGYGRQFDETDVLTDLDRRAQHGTKLTHTRTSYTNDVTLADAYRTPAACEIRVYELLGCGPAVGPDGIDLLCGVDELRRSIALASDGLHDAPFERWDAASDTTSDGPRRRLIAQTCTVFRADRLTRLLPLGHLETLALPGESYKLALTPGLVRGVYRRVHEEDPPEELISDAETILGGEGGYVDLDGDGRWWVPSGRVFYSEAESATPAEELSEALAHFFLPRRFCDPFGNAASTWYDEHDLVVTESLDAVGNRTTALADYRCMQPKRVVDPNGNVTSVAYDSLGRLVGTAVMGKPLNSTGDTLSDFVADLDQVTIVRSFTDPLDDPWKVLQHATTRVVYDLFAFMRTRRDMEPKPPGVYTLSRETHEADLEVGTRTKLRHAFAFFDGFGRTVQSKVQAEPDHRAAPDDPRWVATGWTIYNNKGKPVRQYEPFFTPTPEFEFAVAVGVSPILLYDPLERRVATVHPNRTYEKSVFDPWRQDVWDVNDTVAVADPATDPDVGAFFRRLPVSDYRPTWYEARIGGQYGAAAQAAAERAVAHADTPETQFFDALGRTFLTVARNRAQPSKPVALIETRCLLDIQGNQRNLVDPLGRHASVSDYDMLRQRIRQTTLDAGTRWVLADVGGATVLTWDSSGNRIRQTYDALRRPSCLFVGSNDDSVERLAEQNIYGEVSTEGTEHNLCGRLWQRYDQAGLVTNGHYDVNANLVHSVTKICEGYEVDPDWRKTPAFTADVLSIATSYDALSRPIAITAPDDSQISQRYNDGGLVEHIEVKFAGQTAETPITVDIEYNARSQRIAERLGNGVRRRYTYDPETRLLTRCNTVRRDGVRLQDLAYTYDPIGNVCAVRDAAQQTIFFDNHVVSAAAEYNYDSLYRLVSARGRELIGIVESPSPDPSDAARIHQPLPTDGQAMQGYRESYAYDPVGNLVTVIHHAATANWRRTYTYEGHAAGSQPRTNRLMATSVGESTNRYSYDRNGNLTAMSHLPLLAWDFKNRLRTTQSQRANDCEPARCFYTYDADGNRRRKVVGRGNRILNERIYVGPFEIYRSYGAGSQTKLERKTLHVFRDGRRAALIDTKTIDTEDPVRHGEDPIIRHQIDNHLGSACVELDQDASIISYEEYYPYGSTSLQEVRSGVEVSTKRYRYIAQERDEETGFYHIGARYYAAWLGRWTSCDPLGLAAGPNVYAYARDNPIALIDPTGRAPEDYYDDVNQVCSAGPDAASVMGGGASAIVGGITGAAAASGPTTQTVNIPAISLPSDNVLVRSTGYPQPADGSPVATHVEVDPDPMSNGMSPQNPSRVATPAEHALGDLGEVVTDTQDGLTYKYVMQDSPYLATSANIEQACLAPEGLGFSGDQYLINVDALPKSTEVITNAQVIKSVQDYPATNPGSESRVATYIKNQAVEQETLLKGNVPPEALTPVEDARVTLQGEITTPASGMSMLRGFVVGAVVGLLTHAIASEIVSAGSLQQSPKQREMTSILLGGFPPGVDILAATYARVATDTMVRMFVEGTQRDYERFKANNPDATPFTQSQMDQAAAPYLGDAIPLY